MLLTPQGAGAVFEGAEGADPAPPSCCTAVQSLPTAHPGSFRCFATTRCHFLRCLNHLFEVFCSHLPAGITEWFGLEGTSSPKPCQGQGVAPPDEAAQGPTPPWWDPITTLNPSSQGCPPRQPLPQDGEPSLICSELKLLSQETQMEQGESRAGD